MVPPKMKAPLGGVSVVSPNKRAPLPPPQKNPLKPRKKSPKHHKKRSKNKEESKTTNTIAKECKNDHPPESDLTPKSTHPPATPTQDVDWYYLDDDDVQLGPVNIDQLGQLVESNKVQETTLVWHEDIRDEVLTPAHKVKNLLAYFDRFKMSPPKILCFDGDIELGVRSGRII